MNDLIVNEDQLTYTDGEIELEISVNSETVWLMQKQIVQLFDKNQSVISRHINNILNDGEVDKKSNMQKMHIANSDKPVNFYSLDIVLSVGYRTNSAKAIRFRQWATKILKQYIINGYAINSEKITHQRFIELENDVTNLKSKITHITSKIEDKCIDAKQGIFYDGEIFDAYIFINNLLKNAKREIVLIDSYIDESTLIFFSKYDKISFTVVTKSTSKQLKLDIKNYNTQYNNLTIKTSNKFHDRFLIIDAKKAYHIGASLKDLGKKVFAFSQIDISLIDNVYKEIH